MEDRTEKEIGCIETEEYKFTLCELEGVLFCHVDVFDWSAKIYKKMLYDFTRLCADIKGNLNCCIKKQNKKAQKLASLFGFSPQLETESIIIMVKHG